MKSRELHKKKDEVAAKRTIVVFVRFQIIIVCECELIIPVPQNCTYSDCLFHNSIHTYILNNSINYLLRKLYNCVVLQLYFLPYI